MWNIYIVLIAIHFHFRFMAAEQGGEVFEEPVPSSVLKKPAITKADMKHAVSKFISFTNKHISKTKKTVPTKIR